MFQRQRLIYIQVKPEATMAFNRLCFDDFHLKVDTTIENNPNRLEMNGEDDYVRWKQYAIHLPCCFWHFLSQSGKAQELTNSHRPYGRNKVSPQEIKRIREAGGWISDGRICGDISVCYFFGDRRFITKKKKMLEKGVLEGRWSEKFVSRLMETWLLLLLIFIKLHWGLMQNLYSWQLMAYEIT